MKIKEISRKNSGMTIRMHLYKKFVNKLPTLKNSKHIFLSNLNVHFIPKFTGSPEMKYDAKNKSRSKKFGKPCQIVAGY